MPTLTQSQIQVYAQAAGLIPADKWSAIAMAESGGRTDVVNSIGCVGLWQINQPVHVKSHPTWTVKYLQDPANNARAAKVIAGSQGLSAWQAYTGPDGVGSDGPWKAYYKGGTGTSATDAQWYDPFGIIPGDKGGLSNVVPGASEIGQIADAVTQAAKWISTPYNWVRIGYVVGGGILLIAGVGFIIESTILKKAASNPIVQGATDIIPGGTAVKSFGKKLTGKTSAKAKGKSNGTGSSAKRSGSSASRNGNATDDNSGESSAD